MTTLQAIGFTLLGGATVSIISLVVFGVAVRKQSVYVAPRCAARPPSVIYNPDPNRDKSQDRGSPMLGWIWWTLSLSYDTMLRGVPGTGTRKGGLSGSMLNVNLDAILLLRFHALCLRISFIATLLCLAVIFPINITARCNNVSDDPEDENYDPNCFSDEYKLTNYEKTTLANIPPLEIKEDGEGERLRAGVFGANNSIWGTPFRGILARLYFVVLCSWVVTIYTCRLLSREWGDALALRRVYYLECDHWNRRKYELEETMLNDDIDDEEEEDNKGKGKAKDKKERNRQESDQENNVNDEENGTKKVRNTSDDRASLEKRRQINRSVPSKRREPWIPHPETRDTVPNIELYSVLVGGLPSLPSEVVDEEDIEAAVGFSRRQSIDWQLAVATTFFDHCVPNQPGFSSSVAAVTILPDAPELARAWRKWYVAAAALRRLRFIRRLIADMRHYDIDEDDDEESYDDHEERQKVSASMSTQRHSNVETMQPGKTNGESLANKINENNATKNGSQRSSILHEPDQTMNVSGGAFEDPRGSFQLPNGADPTSVIYSERQNPVGDPALKRETHGHPSQQSEMWEDEEMKRARAVYADTQRRMQYYRDVFGSTTDEEVESRLFQALNYGPEQTAVYSREMAQSAASCCPNGVCGEERLRRARIDELILLEQEAIQRVHEANLALQYAQARAAVSVIETEKSSTHFPQKRSEKDISRHHEEDESRKRFGSSFGVGTAEHSDKVTDRQKDQKEGTEMKLHKRIPSWDGGNLPNSLDMEAQLMARYQKSPLIHRHSFDEANTGESGIDSTTLALATAGDRKRKHRRVGSRQLPPPGPPAKDDLEGPTPTIANIRKAPPGGNTLAPASRKATPVPVVKSNLFPSEEFGKGVGLAASSSSAFESVSADKTDVKSASPSAQPDFVMASHDPTHPLLQGRAGIGRDPVTSQQRVGLAPAPAPSSPLSASQRRVSLAPPTPSPLSMSTPYHPRHFRAGSSKTFPSLRGPGIGVPGMGVQGMGLTLDGKFRIRDGASSVSSDRIEGDDHSSVERGSNGSDLGSFRSSRQRQEGGKSPHNVTQGTENGSFMMSPGAMSGPSRRRLVSREGESILSEQWARVERIITDGDSDKKRTAYTGVWKLPRFQNLGIRLFNQTVIFTNWARSKTTDIVDDLARDSTYAVVTFTSRQAAVAARHCLADGRGANRWNALSNVPIPPLADAAPFDFKTCRGCCRPVTLSVNDKQKMLRRYTALLLLATIYVFYTVPLTAAAGLASPDNLTEIFPRLGDLVDNNVFFNKILSGIVPALLFTLFFALCPIMFKGIANYGSNAVSVNNAEYYALQYYWWFMVVTAFSGSSLVTMVLNAFNEGQLGSEATKVLTTIAATIPTQISATWINWIIVRTMMTLPLQYMLQINSIIFGLIGWKCCARCVMGGGPGGPLPYRVYIDSGTVFLCLVALAPASPLVAPCALFYFLYCAPLWRRNCIFMYRPKFDTGGIRWPLLFDICISSMLVGQILLTTMMALKEAVGPAFLAACPIVPTILFRKMKRTRYLRAYLDAGLLQTSLLDGWDNTAPTSMETREEFRQFLVDAHKAAYIPVCIAGGATSVLTAEPAVVVPHPMDDTGIDPVSYSEMPEVATMEKESLRDSPVNTRVYPRQASLQHGASLRRINPSHRSENFSRDSFFQQEPLLRHEDDVSMFAFTDAINAEKQL